MNSRAPGARPGATLPTPKSARWSTAVRHHSLTCCQSRSRKFPHRATPPPTGGGAVSTPTGATVERRNLLRASRHRRLAAAFGGTLWRGAAYAAPAQPGAGPYGALGARTPTASGSRPASPAGSSPAPARRSPAPPTPGTTPPTAARVTPTAPAGSTSPTRRSTRPAARARCGSRRRARSPCAYRILSSTRQNCAGGETPWNTWLSCEEVDRGYVYETDPWGVNAAVRRDAMGRFKHEAAAADPVRQVIYLTEDETDGCFYRFIPTTWGDLSTGTLQVRSPAPATSGSFTWANVPDPDGSPTATRNQVSGAKRFNGGEGCYYANDTVWFTTKGDNRVWQLNLAAGTIELAYDDSLVTSGTRPADRRRQHHRHRLRRPVRRRGRRQHGDLPHHPERHRRPVPAGRRAVRLRDHRSRVLPGRHAASTSPASAAPAAVRPAASPTR